MIVVHTKGGVPKTNSFIYIYIYICFFHQVIIDAVNYREVKCDLTLPWLQNFWTSTICHDRHGHLHRGRKRWNGGRKVGVTILFLSAIMHRSHACQFFSFFFLPSFAGPRFGEIQKFCYHGNVT